MIYHNQSSDFIYPSNPADQYQIYFLSIIHILQINILIAPIQQPSYREFNSLKFQINLYKSYLYLLKMNTKYFPKKQTQPNINSDPNSILRKTKSPNRNQKQTRSQSTFLTNSTKRFHKNGLQSHNNSNYYMSLSPKSVLTAENYSIQYNYGNITNNNIIPIYEQSSQKSEVARKLMYQNKAFSEEMDKLQKKNSELETICHTIKEQYEKLSNFVLQKFIDKKKLILYPQYQNSYPKNKINSLHMNSNFEHTVKNQIHRHQISNNYQLEYSAQQLIRRVQFQLNKNQKTRSFKNSEQVLNSSNFHSNNSQIDEMAELIEAQIAEKQRLQYINTQLRKEMDNVKKELEQIIQKNNRFKEEQTEYNRKINDLQNETRVLKSKLQQFNNDINNYEQDLNNIASIANKRFGRKNIKISI